MPEFVGELVLKNLNKYKLELEKGVLFTFDTIKTRIRVLPIN
jgi:hypothetical protein